MIIFLRKMSSQSRQEVSTKPCILRFRSYGASASGCGVLSENRSFSDGLNMTSILELKGYRFITNCDNKECTQVIQFPDGLTIVDKYLKNEIPDFVFDNDYNNISSKHHKFRSLSTGPTIPCMIDFKTYGTHNCTVMTNLINTTIHNGSTTENVIEMNHYKFVTKCDHKECVQIVTFPNG